MTLVTLCSAKGSPGVTTLACVLGAVWPAGRAVVVAECDPSGGDLAGRFGLSSRLGMTSLVLTERQGAGEVPDYRAHTQQLPGGLDVLVAPTGADSATALDRELGISSSDLVAGGCDLVADCGRLLPGSMGQARMIRAADRALLVVRPDVAGIAHARWAIGRIGELSPAGAAVVTMGAGTFAPAEVSEELGLDVLGAIPVDPRAAMMACGVAGTARAFVRSDLVAFARELLVALLGQSPDKKERHHLTVGGRPGVETGGQPGTENEATITDRAGGARASHDQRAGASAP
jgi:MinD-like ATPase involved in chromosome partitioning or flagellar assembly